VCVLCEVRLEKQLRTALFSVSMQHVVVISYQRYRTTDWSHFDFWILDSLKMEPVGYDVSNKLLLLTA